VTKPRTTVGERNVAFNLHVGQLEVWNDPRRFKIVVAGRRWGKTTLAVYYLVKAALQNPDPKEWVFYVAPTFQQAKDVIWQTLLEIAHPVIKNLRSNEGIVELVNGCRIGIKGSDRPENMRGVGLFFVVIDEYADMRPYVWEEILSPALAKSQGEAVFIGTPKGRNHFWDMINEQKDDPDWGYHFFKTTDNPFIPPQEVVNAQRRMSSQAFRQEFEASFEAGSGSLFKEEWLKQETEPSWEGEFYMAVDLAGFAEVAVASNARQKKLDRTALAVVKTGTEGWWVKDIIAGRWDIRETSLRILRTAKTNGVRVIGIEKGSLRNAIMPYLSEQMKRLNYFPRIVDTTHGNKQKTERIVWALQGRMEHGRITFGEGSFFEEFKDEYRNFPSAQVHDDMIDALSYVDQISEVVFMDDFDSPDYQSFDETTGY